MSQRELKFCRMSSAKKVFDVSRETLYRWCRDGEITIHKRGHVSLVEVKDVEEYIRGKSE